MRFALVAALLLTTVGLARAAETPFSHDLFDGVLQRYVDNGGRVDYAGLKASNGVLVAYIDSLGRVSPESHPERFPTPGHGLAYWINAYNAFVLGGVSAAYPVDSVKDIGLFNGFFRRHKFRAGGRDMTLDHIENEIIRPLYQDPRIHFAVNCGAVSCPPLGRRAFTGADIDAQLERALAQFAANPQFVRLDRGTGRLQLSKILDWYSDDFVNWFPPQRPRAAAEPTLVDYLLPYLPIDVADYLRRHRQTPIAYDPYDWSLNRQPDPG